MTCIIFILCVCVCVCERECECVLQPVAAVVCLLQIETILMELIRNCTTPTVHTHTQTQPLLQHTHTHLQLTWFYFILLRSTATKQENNAPELIFFYTGFTLWMVMSDCWSSLWSRVKQLNDYLMDCMKYCINIHDPQRMNLNDFSVLDGWPWMTFIISREWTVIAFMFLWFFI